MIAVSVWVKRWRVKLCSLSLREIQLHVRWRVPVQSWLHQVAGLWRVRVQVHLVEIWNVQVVYWCNHPVSADHWSPLLPVPGTRQETLGLDEANPSYRYWGKGPFMYMLRLCFASEWVFISFCIFLQLWSHKIKQFFSTRNNRQRIPLASHPPSHPASVSLAKRGRGDGWCKGGVVKEVEGRQRTQCADLNLCRNI